MSSSPKLAREPQPFPYAETAAAKDGGGTAAEAAEIERREQAARTAGFEAGSAQAKAAAAAELTRTRQAVDQALSAFAGERARYYHKVEGEVVHLALSIARHILHREAAIDPLLLSGIVRVALDKVEASTRTRLRIHPQQVPEWRACFTENASGRQLPEFVEDSSLAPDRCILETDLGTTELGIEVQFKEIERGLLDLLAQRPGCLP